jgi:putative ABC transport system permease protein
MRGTDTGLAGWEAVLTAALRDLQWRKRRFVIAIIGTGLVFAMTLVLTGLANGFRVEAQRTINSLGLDSFFHQVRRGRAVCRLGTICAQRSDRWHAARGHRRVPMVYGSTTIPDRGSSRNVNVFGAPERGPGCQRWLRAASRPAGDIAVSSTMGRGVGQDIEIGSRTMRIVGIVTDSTCSPGRQCVLDGGWRPAAAVLGAGADLVNRHPRHTGACPGRLPRRRPRRRRRAWCAR